MDELTIPFLEDELAGWQYPFGDLHRAGAPLAAGSDWPVSSPDPLLGIHVAVNRTVPDGDQPAFLPEQRLELSTALRAYTLGTARLNHLDAETGTIETGKLADLVLTNRDPFAGGPAALATTKVLATYIEGVCVHADPEL
jgi:predicted amidohydrolase YtcJ